MNVEVAASALKHRISEDAIEHAFEHPILSEDVEDGMVMLVGPDRAGNLLEIGVVEGSAGPVVVHAMKARPKYLR